MNYNEFIKLSNEFGIQMYEKEISLSGKIIRFASVILREDVPIEEVLASITDQTSLVVLFQNFSNHEVCEECCLFYVEEGYRCIVTQEFDMSVAISQEMVISEKDHDRKGLIGVVITSGEKGILVNPVSAYDNQFGSFMEIGVVHNAVEFVQVNYN